MGLSARAVGIAERLTRRALTSQNPVLRAGDFIFRKTFGAPRPPQTLALAAPHCLSDLNVREVTPEHVIRSQGQDPNDTLNIDTNNPWFRDQTPPPDQQQTPEQKRAMVRSAINGVLQRYSRITRGFAKNFLIKTLATALAVGANVAGFLVPAAFFMASASPPLVLAACAAGTLVPFILTLEVLYRGYKASSARKKAISNFRGLFGAGDTQQLLAEELLNCHQEVQHKVFNIIRKVRKPSERERSVQEIRNAMAAIEAGKAQDQERAEQILARRNYTRDRNGISQVESDYEFLAALYLRLDSSLKAENELLVRINSFLPDFRSYREQFAYEVRILEIINRKAPEDFYTSRNEITLEQAKGDRKSLSELWTALTLIKRDHELNPRIERYMEGLNAFITNLENELKEPPLSAMDQQALEVCGRVYGNDAASLRIAYQDMHYLAELKANFLDRLVPQVRDRVSHQLQSLMNTIVPKLQEQLGLKLTGHVKNPRTGKKTTKTYLVELVADPDSEDPAQQIECGLLIGSGGMAEVYKARDLETNQKVAIKIIKPATEEGLKMEDRGRREAAIGLNLKHENVVEVFAAGKTRRGQPFIAMEYLSGPNLDQVIADYQNRGDTIGTRKAVQWALQVLKGLAAAHRQGIVHRDVKCGNIFLSESTRSAQSDILVLSDFGLGKTLDAEAVKLASEIKNLTHEITIMGTYEYMAPELPLIAKLIEQGELTDNQKLEWYIRSDVYAAGVVLYELLTTGRRPFLISNQQDYFSFSVSYDGQNFILSPKDSYTIDPSQKDSLIQQNQERLPDKFKINTAGLPAGLDAIVAKALAYNPQNRYQNTHEFIRELDAWLKGVSPKDRSQEAYARTVNERAKAPPPRAPLSGTPEQIKEDLEAILYSQEDAAGNLLIVINPSETRDWIDKISSLKDVDEDLVQAAIAVLKADQKEES